MEQEEGMTAEWLERIETENGSIEFVEYTGDYPALCVGDLKLRIDGKEVTLVRYVDFEVMSGGNVWFDDDGIDNVEHGAWSVTILRNDMKMFEQEISRLFNLNVDYGCCGGCI
jgi:hypothetical protein